MRNNDVPSSVQMHKCRTHVNNTVLIVSTLRLIGTLCALWLPMICLVKSHVLSIFVVLTPAKWWNLWLLLTFIRCLHSEKEFEPEFVIMVCNLGGYSLLWVPIVKSDQEWFHPNIHDKCLENRLSVIRVETAIWTDAGFSNLMAGSVTGIIYVLAA